MRSGAMTRQTDATVKTPPNVKEIVNLLNKQKPSAVRKLDMGEESDAIPLEEALTVDDDNILTIVANMEVDAESAAGIPQKEKKTKTIIPSVGGLKQELIAVKQVHGLVKKRMKPDCKATNTITGPAISNPWKKMKKLHVVRPDFDVIYADVLVKLNNSNYLLYGSDSEDNPVIRIQDCGYKRADCGGGEGAKYVPRCVKLTTRQWLELLDIGEQIVQSLSEDEDKRAHIGHNTFITVKSDRGVVDIRDYFLPADDRRDEEVAPCQFFDDLVPTKRGVQLSASGWQMLIGRAASVLRDFAGTTIDYSLGTCEHNGQTEYMACIHCNPNGWHLWRAR